MAYYEEICKDYIRGYPGGGDDPTFEMPGAVRFLSHLLSYTPELYPGVASGITSQKVQL